MYTNGRSPHGPSNSAERAVYDYVQQEILAGRLVGGAPIRQEEIADRLSLSRIPVRDALRHLVAEGFVTIESNRRAVVTALSEQGLSELFEMRAVLEGLAARHAVRTLNASDFDHLAWLAERMDQTETAGNQWLPIHNEFHEFLCAKAGMPRLSREISRLRHSVEPQLRVLIALNGYAELRSSHHRSLVTAIRSKNPDRAEQAIREHVMQASRDILHAIAGTKSQKSSEPVVTEKRRRK